MNRFMKWITGTKEYTVEYLAWGMMNNRYTTGIYTFQASKRDIKNHGSITNVGVSRNYKELIRHYESGSMNNRYSARILTPTNNQTQ